MGIPGGQGRRRSVDLWFFRPSPDFFLTWGNIEFVRTYMGFSDPECPGMSLGFPAWCGVRVGLSERGSDASAVVHANEHEACPHPHISAVMCGSAEGDQFVFLSPGGNYTTEIHKRVRPHPDRKTVTAATSASWDLGAVGE